MSSSDVSINRKKLKLGKLLCAFLCNWYTNVFLFIVVKVAGVARTSALWYEWRLHLVGYRREWWNSNRSVGIYKCSLNKKANGTQLMSSRWWVLYLSLIDGYPIRCGKPFVVFDIIDAIPEVAIPLGQVHLKQIPQQIFQIRAEVGGESYLKHSNRYLDCLSIVCKRIETVCVRNLATPFQTLSSRRSE